MKRLVQLVLGLVLALGGTQLMSCASERPARSFVQPNALKKADLTGTYYYTQTVTDAPPTNGAMFIGQSSSLMKVKFDVQENFLYARRSYEQIEGMEDAKVENPDGYMGQPLAAWRIESHFDIIRDFNSTTGEQTNRIIESMERPWNEREFIRVDWSQNLVTDYVGLGIDFFFSDGGAQVQPVTYWESDPSKPDALHIERADAAKGGFGQNEMTYLDLTNQMIVTPEQLTLRWEENGQPQSFTVPKCFLGYLLDDCASQRIKVRHAFAKIDPTHDYEPRDWDGLQMELFGVWDVGLRRLGYNRDYGVTNTGASRYAARFNLWKKSYRINAETGARELIPHAERELAQIPYYASGSKPFLNTDANHPRWPVGFQDRVYPEELYPDFVRLVGEWDDALRGAVRALGKEVSDDTKILVPCHNPVDFVNDPAVCREGLTADVDSSGKTILDKQGNPILRSRQGDPRHSIVFWVNQQQDAGPLGYGPPMYDPETGETISGQAYIYGGAIDSYTARSRDLMLLQNGEIAIQDYINGANVRDWVRDNRFATESEGVTPPQGQALTPETQATLDELTERATPKTFTRKQVSDMARAMDFSWARGFSPQNGYPDIDTSSIDALKKSMEVRERAIFRNYYAHRSNDRDDRLQKLVGSPLEKMMVTPEAKVAAGISPMRDWSEMTGEEKARVSPLREKLLLSEIEKVRRGAEIRGVDFATFDEVGLSQRLYRLKRKYGPKLMPVKDQVLAELRHDIFYAVTLHEVGHNMGCRHNFRGSYDAMNFYPKYWELRTDAVNHPDPGMEPADGKLHARYVNKPGGKISKWEVANGINEYQYSSIMDYGSEFNTDFMGLGLYDKAVIKFSYARAVEVFTEVKDDEDSRKKLGAIQSFQSALGFPSALGSGEGLSAIAYQTYPQLFKNGRESIYKRETVPYSQIRRRNIGTQGDSWLVDSQRRPLVPYYFCSDEYAGNMTCQRFDHGADLYEQATDIVSRYHNFYLANNFKRDRATFHSSLSYRGRIGGRYFAPLHAQLTWYSLLRGEFEDFLTRNADLGFGDPSAVQGINNGFFTDEYGWGNFTAAVTTGFDLLGQVVTTPNAGWHVEQVQPDGSRVWTQFRDDVTDVGDARIKTVGMIDGKYIETRWDNERCGYYWGDECQSRIGYLLDKTVALDVLTQSQAYFTGRDTSVDVRQYAIGYYLPFKAQMTEKLGALISGDVSSVAPYFDAAGKLVNPGWTIPADPVQKPALVDPATGFTISLYTGAYAMASLPSTFDHDFVDNSQVFVVGNGEAPIGDAQIENEGTYDPAELVSHGGSREWLLVRDVSGKTFAAHSLAPQTTLVLDQSAGTDTNFQSTTGELRRDTGVRMLERLLSYRTAYEEAQALDDTDPNKLNRVSYTRNEYEKFRQNIEVMRSLQRAFGYGPFFTDAPFYY